MFITLVAVVVALVLGHVVPEPVVAMRRYHWYGHWLRMLDARFDEGSAWQGRFGILFAVIPPLLLVGLFQYLLHSHWLGLASLLFGIIVLVYAWGPRNLDVDVEAVIDAPDAQARRDAISHLQPEEGIAVTEAPVLVEMVIRAGLRRWFGVLFWFLLLGPVGAVLYRLAVLSAEDGFLRNLPPQTAVGARILRGVLEWPVAQLMTLSMALVGNFDAVYGAWRAASGNALRLDIGFLDAVARTSVKYELAEEALDYTEQGIVPILRELPELRDAMSLVWRILLLWLALLALFVIAGWVS